MRGLVWTHNDRGAVLERFARNRSCVRTVRLEVWLEQACSQCRVPSSCGHVVRKLPLAALVITRVHQTARPNWSASARRTERASFVPDSVGVMVSLRPPAAALNQSDSRFPPIRVVIDAPTVLAVCGVTALLDGLVTPDVQPCPVPQNSAARAERVCHDVHRTAAVLADRVLCYLAA